MTNSRSSKTSRAQSQVMSPDVVRLRMLLAVLTVAAVGFPLWWMTTSTYRATLPWDSLHALAESKPKTTWNIPLTMTLLIPDDQESPWASCAETLLESSPISASVQLTVGSHQALYSAVSAVPLPPSLASHELKPALLTVNVIKTPVELLPRAEEWSTSSPFNVSTLEEFLSTVTRHAPGLGPFEVPKEALEYIFVSLHPSSQSEEVASARPQWTKGRTAWAPLGTPPLDPVCGSVMRETFSVTAASLLWDVWGGAQAVNAESVAKRFPPSSASSLSVVAAIANAQTDLDPAWPSTQSLSELRSMLSVATSYGLIPSPRMAQVTVPAWTTGPGKSPGGTTTPDWDASTSTWVLSEADLTRFVPASAWSLAPAPTETETGPQLRFVAYVPPLAHRPLQLPNNAPGVELARWGGFSLLNPAPGTSGQWVVPQGDLEKLSRVWSAQLAELIGLSDVATDPQMVVGSSASGPVPGIATWALDRATRMRALESLDRAERALLDGVEMIADITHMVVPDSLVGDVEEALEALAESRAALAEVPGTPEKTREALHSATVALGKGEGVWFQADMLAPLYFPDEHKYAIYTPFFVPVAVPILLAILRELKLTKLGLRMPSYKDGVAIETS